MGVVARWRTLLIPFFECSGRFFLRGGRALPKGGSTPAARPSGRRATGTRETSVGAAHTERDAAWRQNGYAHYGAAEWSGRCADSSADSVPSPRSAHASPSTRPLLPYSETDVYKGKGLERLFSLLRRAWKFQDLKFPVKLQ